MQLYVRAFTSRELLVWQFDCWCFAGRLHFSLLRLGFECVGTGFPFRVSHWLHVQLSVFHWVQRSLSRISPMSRVPSEDCQCIGCPKHSSHFQVLDEHLPEVWCFRSVCQLLCLVLIRYLLVWLYPHFIWQSILQDQGFFLINLLPVYWLSSRVGLFQRLLHGVEWFQIVALKLIDLFRE